MLYIFYNRISNDGRAPAIVNINDYEEIGNIEGSSRNNACYKFYTQNKEETKHTTLKVGDLIKEDFSNKFCILTPSMQWSEVRVVQSKK